MHNCYFISQLQKNCTTVKQMHNSKKKLQLQNKFISILMQRHLRDILRGKSQYFCYFPLRAKENCHCAFYFAVLQFVLQLCHVFCSCAFSFADVLKLCTIPTYNFADVQMKYLLCYVFCSCTFSLSVVNCFRSCTIFSLAFLAFHPKNT